MTAEECEARYRARKKAILSCVPPDDTQLAWWQRGHRLQSPEEYARVHDKLRRDIAKLSEVANEWAQFHRKSRFYSDTDDRRMAHACAWGMQHREDEADRLKRGIIYARHQLACYDATLTAHSSSNMEAP